MAKPRQVTDAPVSTSPLTGMPSIWSRPEMGGATAHPTGATLASGDPPVSLNAMGEFESCHSPVEALRPGLVEAFWPVLASASVATGCGQGSDRQSAPLRHRGSTLLAVCPVDCPGA